MKKKTERKKISFRRAGCLMLVVLFLALAIGLFRMVSGRHALPSSFVLLLELSGELKENGGVDASLPFGDDDGSSSLQELLFALDRAEHDERISHIVLDITGFQAPPAALTQLRRAIMHARKSGREVTAFLGGGAEDKDLWLASACDTVIVEKGGVLQLDGLKVELLYFADAMEKVGVAFQAAQWKEWKSGVEPFVRNAPSRESLEQMGVMLDEIFRVYVDDVASARGIARDTYVTQLDEEPLWSPSDALERGLVDGIAGRWEFFEGDPDRVVVDVRSYSREFYHGRSGSGPSIAVVNLTGQIVRDGFPLGPDMEGSMSEALLQEALQQALEDEDVRGILLRIDSPGGDALAAVGMLEQLEAAAREKPMVASISSVAASGGYMAALAADSVFAEPLSVTGSVGVYALKPHIGKLSDMAGVSRSVVQRGRHADDYSIFKPLDSEAMGRFMAASGWIYEDFTGAVARARGMSAEEVELAAGGRVWTGTSAVDMGLVDRTGGFFDALLSLQRMAGMDTIARPPMKIYPAPKSLLDLLFSGNINGAAGQLLRSVPGYGIAERVHFIGEVPRLSEPYLGGLHSRAVMPWRIRVR
ncbi:S49 family peptidase [Prosthecochloris sp. CIB 2401]|uniref:S49 family peptidase n=1 Tax=Prosthecochloris sp. CIB 2401 TaxID=1868325 RepID=UPI00080AAA72|nr:S49 family peptidase [Prosthecochloris sp. CIB 2401]ANT64338.1 Protease 4 [Prosthecochloris sp. CIB 2401]